MSFESRTPGLKSTWWTPRLAWLLLAAAIVRFLLYAIAVACSGTHIVIGGDTVSYLVPGRNLLLHGQFVADGVPDLIRTPGYPLFLAITSLAGMQVAAVVNILLSIFCVLLVWRLAYRIFIDNRIALGAAWIAAFEPVLIENSFLLQSETLFAALFLLSMERLVRFFGNHKLTVLIQAGLWLAAAIYVRPVAYYLPCALAAGLLVVFARTPSLRLKAPAVLLLAVIPCLAIWHVRNYLVAEYKGFASISDVNLYFSNAGIIIARQEHRKFWVLVSQMGWSTFTDHTGQLYLYPKYVDSHPEQVTWNQTQRLAFMHAEAIRILRAHMGFYLRICLENLIQITFKPGSSEIDQYLSLHKQISRQDKLDLGPVKWMGVLVHEYPWAVAEMLAFEIVILGIYLFAIRGAFRMGTRNPILWLLLGVSLYFLFVAAIVGGASSDARYRLPSMPCVCILAAAGVQRLRSLPASKEHC